ncbi:MAG: methyltransferase domain-containing protein [Symploca sp. SIO2D2]|nr:methyltransferase domain-containing protein [Symploca sp. SIO2D2]
MKTLAKSWKTVVSVVTTYRNSTALFAAAELGIFRCIPSTGATAFQISDNLDISLVGSQVLLNFLCSINLLKKDANFYYISDSIYPWVRSGESCALSDLLLHKRENEIWLKMPEILKGKTKAPEVYRNELLNSHLGSYNAIQSANRLYAETILSRLTPTLMKASHVLDIGGGHGYYAGRILDINPKSSVTIQDLEGGFEVCKIQQAKEIETGRLKLLIGDARNYHHDSRYDLVMINELLELFPRNEKKSIIDLAMKSLSSDGLLAISKFTLSRDGTSPMFSAIFSVRMLMKTNGAGYLETDEEVAEIICECGGTLLAIEKVDDFKTLILARAHDYNGPEEDNSIITMGRPRVYVDEPQFEAWLSLISIATSFRFSSIFLAVLELGIFPCLHPDGATAAEVSQTVGISVIAAQVLLNSLCTIGIVNLERDRYTLAVEIQSLLKTNWASVVEALMLYSQENDLWLRMVDIMRSHKSVLSSLNMSSINHIVPESVYLFGVELSNQEVCQEMFGKIQPEVMKATHVLDIGGGHGMHSSRVLEMNHQVNVTIIDLSNAIKVCEKRQKHHLEQGRMQLIVGDARTYEFKNTFDLVMINDLLHYFNRTDKELIIARAMKALAADGVLVISKFRLEPNGIEPAGSASFSLKVFLKTSVGYLPSDEEVVDILQKQGGNDIEVLSLGQLYSLIVMRR